MDYTVLQFGEGNFIRAFFDWMLERIAAATGEKHAVFLVQPIAQGHVDELVRAGTYSVLLRGFRNGNYEESLESIDVIRGGCNPFEGDGMSSMLAAALSPSLKVVTSNTTEAGIFFEEHPKPHNYPSLLTAVLRERSAAALPPLSIMPLELIENNGQALKACIERYARLWKYDDAFFDYLDACRFYDTLVDRIVPGFPAKEAPELCRKLGKEDPFITSGELFHLFVIQGGREILDVLPFHKADLNVIVTGDKLGFYRDRKVRILNGVHTASVPVALLNGIEYVRDFVEDPRFAPRLQSLVHDEIVPAFSDDAEAHRYGDDVLERFRNPALEHAFRSIALNSVAKCNTRLRPTLEGYHAKFNALPPVLTTCIEAMTDLYYCDGIRDLPGGPYILSDFEQLRGRTIPDMTDSFFPGLNAPLRKELVERLERYRRK